MDTEPKSPRMSPEDTASTRDDVVQEAQSQEIAPQNAVPSSDDETRRSETVENNEPTQTPPVSPWIEYLTEKKVPADRFLNKISKEGIPIPDEALKRDFAAALLEKKDRISRLTDLIQKASSFNETIVQIVTELSEASIKQLAVFDMPAPLDATTYHIALLDWLHAISKKPLKTPDLTILLLLLNYGALRQLLDHDSVLGLLAAAIYKPEKGSTKNKQTAPSVPTPLEILLSAPTSVPVLSSLLAYSKACKEIEVDLRSEIQTQIDSIRQLTQDCTGLETEGERLHAEIEQLKKEKGTADEKIIELEKQMVEIRDGYQHKINELRGRIRGKLQGQLTRWLQTAVEASSSNPPFTDAIQERLEDALKLIEKEVQWLQPSE